MVQYLDGMRGAWLFYNLIKLHVRLLKVLAVEANLDNDLKYETTLISTDNTHNDCDTGSSLFLKLSLQC